MPQSQSAANPRHLEEEKNDKNIHAQNKQTHVREAQSEFSRVYPGNHLFKVNSINI